MKPLRVLHISTWDNAGGSGRAAYRIHTGLRGRGVDSRMLVGHRTTKDDSVRTIGGRFDRAVGSLVDWAGFQYLHYPSSFRLPENPWVREADVIQLYNTHGGYFSHRAIAPLSQLKPLVWRLSDMWALTGHCSYSYGCERWKSGCGKCPEMSEYPALRRDNTQFLFEQKRKIYERSRITVVAPSRWLLGIAKQSPLLRRFEARYIPNGLDLSVFAPQPKPQAKRELGIDPDRKVLLAGAESLLSKRKGGTQLKQALKLLGETLRGTTLLVLGAEPGSIKLNLPAEIKAVAKVSEDRKLARIYSAADLFLLPTLADNLPNSLLESMACGTAQVAYAVGGVPEALRHMETGYAAKPADAADFAAGIRLLLGDAELLERMGRNSRQTAQREYGLDLQTQRFESLYRELAGPS